WHMQRICFLLRVKKDRLEEYKQRHKSVWPAMLAALRETGWQNYSLFLRDDGLLVGYLETRDFEAARAGMAGRDVNERWQRDMAPFFESDVKFSLLLLILSFFYGQAGKRLAEITYFLIISGKFSPETTTYIVWFHLTCKQFCSVLCSLTL
ncbi:MAG: L-rhamnose mutarotase, partial [Methanosarcina sp.]